MSVKYPLLRLEQAVLDFEGGQTLKAIDLSVCGNRVGLTGQACQIPWVLEGKGRLLSGCFEIDGQPALRSLAEGRIGIARPWTAALATIPLEDGLEASTCLMGLERRPSRKRVAEVLRELDLSKHGRRPLGRGVRADHYLAGLAEAILTEPQILIAEWPVGNLDPGQWDRYGVGLSRAMAGRRLLAILEGPPQSPVEWAWFGSLDEAIHYYPMLGLTSVPTDRSVVRTFIVVHGKIQGFLDELAKLDVVAKLVPTVNRDETSGSEAVSCHRLLVDLPRDNQGLVKTDSIITLCHSLRLTLYHLEPLDVAV